MSDSERDALEQAKEMIIELQAMIDVLTAPPNQFGVVQEVITTGVVVATDNKTVILEKPHEFEVAVTDMIAISSQTGQIVRKVELGSISGLMCVVTDRAGKFIEVEVGGNSTLVTFNEQKEDPVKGDRVILDPTGSIVLRNLGKDNSKFKLMKRSTITWEDIGGLDEPKAQLREAIELPLLYPEIYQHYHKKPLRGALLFGPPGCGKTLLGKAAASAIQEIYNEEGESNAFMYVKGPEILDKYVGVAEQRIRSIFSRARDYKEKHGHPCVVFIDEADALLAKRGSRKSSDMEATIVPMFLSEMDGLDDNACFVLLATNRPDTIDDAILRDGRIDRKIRVSRPDQRTAKEIFAVHLEGIPTDKSLNKDQLAVLGSEELFAAEHALYNIDMKEGEPQVFGLGQVCSGAMIAGIVDRATSLAMHRDLEGNAKTGISPEDLRHAVALSASQLRELDHKDDVTDFVQPFKDKIKRVVRVGV